MSGNEYRVGMIVTHPNMPEWGPGQVVTITDTSVHIFFRDDPENKTRMFNRILPNGPIGWNSSNLDYVEPIPHDINYFVEPKKIYSLNDLQQSPPPSSPGIYGWYFNKPPPYVPTKGCTLIKTGWWPFRTKWWLLYVGKADKLEDRIINYHIKGEHYAQGTMSSLRLSLGCLLSDKFGLELYYPPESFGKKDKKLQKWLEKHARVAWIPTENLAAMEPEAIEKYILPLNHKHNQHPLKIPLSKLRVEFKHIARSQKPRKKHFRKAYKQFVKECKGLGIKK